MQGSKAQAKPFEDPDSLRVAMLDNWRLQLTNCELQVAHGERTWRSMIDLPGHCEFVRGLDGKAQVVDTEHGAVVLVVSSYLLREPEGFCNTQMRAIAMQGDALRISTAKQKRMQCGGKGPFDTKNFHVLPGAPGDEP